MPPTIPVNLNQLIAQFPKYQDPNRIRTDVMNVWRHRQSLVPKRGKLTLNTGQECELLMLEGTFSIVYRAVEYYTPVEIYITDNYPTSPPMCYIRPTAGMSLKVGHKHVDQGGLVYLPYLHEWTARTHNLVELIANMSSVFGAEPPLFATPTGPRPAPAPSPAPGYPAPRGMAAGAVGASPYGHPHTGRHPVPHGGPSGRTPAPAPPVPERPNPEQVRKVKEGHVTAKLQGELRRMYEGVGADMDSAFETQAQLEDDQTEVEAAVAELSRRNKELERLIKVSKERERELDTYLEEMKKEGEPTVDDLIEPKDVLSKQMLRLVAENAALEDALYYLDLGVTDSVISVEVFLKEIRRLARKQFVARATMKKVERAQHEVKRQRAAFNAQQQQQQQQAGGRAYYPNLPAQQQHMGGPPPVYTPPAANYRGAAAAAGGYGGHAAGAAYGHQPAAGTASSWGGAAAAGATGMYGGYPAAHGGAQTSHTQRR